MTLSNNNKFENAGMKCVFSDNNYFVYKIDTIEQAILTTSTTGWCMHKPEKFSTSHTDEKYVVVKKLPDNHIKIVLALDLGFGLIRMTNNQIVTKQKIQPIKHIIEYMFTEKIVASIKPKSTDGYEIPDIWYHRNLSPTIKKSILSNKNIVKSVYINKNVKIIYPFYSSNSFPFLKEIIKNKKIIIDEIRNNIDDNKLINFLSDFYDKDSEKLQGKWLTDQFYYNKKNKTKVNKTLWHSKEDKKQWLKNLREGPQKYPKTCELLKNCKNIYWAAISKIGPNSHIKPHKHIYNSPTIIFQICIEPGIGDGECTLIADGKKLNWNEKGQVNIFDGRSTHELINTMNSSRYILHIEFNPQGYEEFKNI